MTVPVQFSYTSTVTARILLNIGFIIMFSQKDSAHFLVGVKNDNKHLFSKKNWMSSVQVILNSHMLDTHSCYLREMSTPIQMSVSPGANITHKSAEIFPFKLLMETKFQFQQSTYLDVIVGLKERVWRSSISDTVYVFPLYHRAQLSKNY